MDLVIFISFDSLSVPQKLNIIFLTDTCKFLHDPLVSHYEICFSKIFLNTTSSCYTVMWNGWESQGQSKTPFMKQRVLDNELEFWIGFVIVIALLFLIPCTVLLSSIQPEAESLSFSTTHFREIFRKSSHHVNTKKGGVTNHFGNDVEGYQISEGSVQSKYPRISAIQCKWRPCC